MSLGVLTAVLEWVEQLRIKTCQASQILCVYLICFALGGVDEPQFPSIGHQHLVAAVLEYPANPRRVGACLYGYAQWLLLRGEASPEGFGDGTQSRPSSITSPPSVSIRHRWLYLSPRSIPTVIGGFLLLPSSMGRSSFLWAKVESPYSVCRP
jgi:hypothetical protein